MCLLLNSKEKIKLKIFKTVNLGVYDFDCSVLSQLQELKIKTCNQTSI